MQKLKALVVLHLPSAVISNEELRKLLAALPHLGSLSARNVHPTGPDRVARCPSLARLELESLPRAQEARGISCVTIAELVFQ